MTREAHQHHLDNKNQGDPKIEDGQEVLPVVCQQEEKTIDEEESTPKIVAPDGGYGWVVVFAAFLASFILDGIIYAFSPYLERLIVQFGEPRSKVAWIGSLTTGSAFLSGPLISAFANKFGLRPVCIVGALVAALAMVITIFAQSIEFLMMTQGVLAGIGFGCIYLPCIVIVGIYFDKKRTFANGIAVCGSSLGSFVFPPLVNLLINEFGWKGSNLILAGVILNCCWLGGLMRPLNKASKKANAPLEVGLKRTQVDGEASQALVLQDSVCETKLLQNVQGPVIVPSKESEHLIISNCDLKKEGKSQSLKEMILKDLDLSLFKNVTFLMICAAHFCAFLAFYTPFVYLPAAAMQKGIDQSSATFLISIIGITNTLGRVGSGAFAAIPGVNPLWFHNICLMAAGTALILTRYAFSYGSFASIACIFGMAMSTYISLTSPILVSVFGVEKLSNAFGFIILFWGISSIVGAPISGKISELTDSFDASFFYSGGLFWCCALLFCLVPFSMRLQNRQKKLLKNYTVEDQVNKLHEKESIT